MTDKVKPFVAPLASNDEVIAMLEEYIARAKAGQVLALAIVTVKPGSTIASEWTGAASGWLHHLISGVSILKHRMLMLNVDPG